MNGDDRTDVDLGGWGRTLLRHWWLVVGLVALGVVTGAVATLAQPDEYSATASVYIGQTTDANGNPMAGLNSNAKAAVQLVGSGPVLREAAKATGRGMTTSRLRRETTVETPSSTVKTTSSVVNIVVITVTDTDPARAAAAANALADALLARLTPAVDGKIALLERQLQDEQRQLAAARARAAAAQKALDAIARGGGGASEKALAAAPYLAVVQAAASEQQALLASAQKTELMLLTARQVERPRLLHEATVPDAPSGPLMGLNVAAGALAGLVVGVLAAFARQRLRGGGAA